MAVKIQGDLVLSIYSNAMTCFINVGYLISVSQSRKTNIGTIGNEKILQNQHIIIIGRIFVTNSLCARSSKENVSKNFHNENVE